MLTIARIILAALVSFAAGAAVGWYKAAQHYREQRDVEIAAAVLKAREEEKQIAKDHERIINDALKNAERNASDALDAKKAAEGARDAARAAVARARRLCAQPAPNGASPAPTPAEPSTAADDPIGVLGRVFAECGEQLAAVADFADRSRLAGLTCERAYDSAREALKPH